MEALRSLLEQQPLMALFLTIAIGHLAGEISIKGFSLGVGAVLFVALAVGLLAPQSAPPPVIGTLGLALFLYAVGIQYGTQFFLGLTTTSGLKANAIACSGVLLSGVTTLLVVGKGLGSGYALGLFAGAGTSTPTLQAAIASLGNDQPAVGYSVAYPLGVAGPILCLYLVFQFWKPRLAAPAAAGMELLEIALKHHEFFGKRVCDVTRALPAQVQIVAVRRDDHNHTVSPQTVVTEDDALLLVGPTRAALDQARLILGEAAAGRLVEDRRDLDYLRAFASRPAVVGRMLRDLDVPGDRASVVVHVLRGDVDIAARPDLVLEFGDRVGVLANRSDFPVVRKFFGDSIKGTAEFSYISIGLGMALGFLIGAIGIPLPGAGELALGLSGVLIVALVLGKLRRSAGLNWTIPISANLVLRNLGLTVFLAQVGISSGPAFAATISETGFVLLGLAAMVVTALVLPILLLTLLVFRMPFDQAAGILAGACGNPAILAYSNTLVPTDAPDVGYAMIFPGMTILKIVFVDIAPSLL